MTHRRAFDPYNRAHYWVVTDFPRSQKEAHFPDRIYGKARAERLAQKFARKLSSGEAWDDAYQAIPKD